MHTVFALLCFVVVIHWLIFPYPSGLLHWHCGNLTIAPVPAKQPWWIWINTSCEFIMNDCIITTKQSTTKPCAYYLGYTVRYIYDIFSHINCTASGKVLRTWLLTTPAYCQPLTIDFLSWNSLFQPEKCSAGYFVIKYSYHSLKATFVYPKSWPHTIRSNIWPIWN